MSSVPYMNPQSIFYQQYSVIHRDKAIGVLLALFFGTFGVHHFYMRNPKLGFLYLCLFWTGIPTILGIIECFFMPRRIEEYNAVHAAGIAATLGIEMPEWGKATEVPSQPIQSPTLIACHQCQQTNPAGSRFCSTCGAGL